MNIKQSVAVLIIITILIMLSCTRDSTGYQEEGSGILHISISVNNEEDTKTSVLQNQESDNNVETLDVFIFRETHGEDNGILDTYKRFQGEELEMSDLMVNTTTGEKNICIIANSHISDYSLIKNIEQYKKIESLLSKERSSSYTMTGSEKATLGISTRINVSIRRLISCVIIDDIKTAFADSPYEGCPITNVKIYLTNIIGNKLIYSGLSTQDALIFNHKGNKPEDSANCIQSGLFSDDISSAITDNGYTQKHYLYCYENMTSTEADNLKFTRAVIQGDLCGKTYYYPININQEGYGYSESNGHHGIKRNSIYIISVTIFRPGSTDPDIPITLGCSESHVSIENWNSTVESNIIF